MDTTSQPVMMGKPKTSEPVEGYFTVVFKNPTVEEVKEIVHNPRTAWVGWGHAVRERDATIDELKRGAQ